MTKPGTAAATSLTPQSRRTFLASTSVLSALGGISSGHPAASLRFNAQRSHLIAAVERYRNAAVSYSGAFPCSDEDAGAVSEELISARSALVHAVRMFHCGTQLSPLGALIEEAAPQAVLLHGMLVVVAEPTDSEDGPTVHLLPLTDVADLS